MKYKVCIRETVEGEFEVEAASKEEALKIANEKYDSCEFVNEPGELVEKRILVNSSDKENAFWEIF